jgi:hypothetical protein
VRSELRYTLSKGVAVNRVLSSYQKTEPRPFYPISDARILIYAPGSEEDILEQAVDESGEWATYRDVSSVLSQLWNEQRLDAARIVGGSTSPQIWVRHGNTFCGTPIGYRSESGALRVRSKSRFGWINPDGLFFPCRYGEHDELADALHKFGRIGLERAGWCCTGPLADLWGDGFSATEAQAATLLRLSEQQS